MNNVKFKPLMLWAGMAIAALILLSSGTGIAEDKGWYWYMGKGSAAQPAVQEENKYQLPSSGDNPVILKSTEQNYAPNEIIVKFKKETADSLKLDASLDNLNKKYKAKNIEPIFKDFKKNLNRLDTIKLHKELKTKYSIEAIKFSKKESHILKRLERAPKDAQIPALDRIYKLELEEGQSVEEAVAEYSKDPNIEYAEPNYIVEICSTPLPDLPYIPNDYYVEDAANPEYWREGNWGQVYPDLWGLQKAQAIEAYNIFDINENGAFDPGEIKPGEGVIVAVIDTGVDCNHEDLAANIWTNADEIPGNGIDDDGNGKIDDIRGWDFSYGDNNPMDGHGHGTHCSGTIAAIGNNNIGVIGIAPYAIIMAVKGLDDSGSGFDATLAECVRYAADNGADVLSNSWGGSGASQVLTDAFHYANSLGCVSIAAAGNNNADVSGFMPANIDTVTAVSAFNQNDQKCDFSNYGDKIDVAAPGGDSQTGDGSNFWGRNILSLRSDNNGNPTDMYGGGVCVVGTKYYRSRGTSMACPHAAGAAALILSRHPEFSPQKVKQVLRVSSDDVGAPGFDINSGYGRINAYKACQIDDPPEIYISYPSSGQYINGGTLDIIGTAEGSYVLEYKKSEDVSWIFISSGYDVFEGILGTLSGTENLDIGTYIVRLTINSGGFSFVENVKFLIDPFMEGGWPVFLGSGGLIQIRDLVVSDINGDGYAETVATSISIGSSMVYVFDRNGNSVSGWPIGIPAELYFSSPPTVGDMDNDGDYEIVVGGGKKIYAWHHNGNPVAGWPIEVSEGAFDSVISAADLNNDGRLEIVAIANKYKKNAFDTEYSRVYVFRDNGTLFSGNWPKLLSTTTYKDKCGPAIGDLDNNGSLEIVIPQGISDNGLIPPMIYVFNADGTQYISPVNLPSYWTSERIKCILVDIDKNGDLEIFYSDYYYIGGFHHNGAPIGGNWPVYFAGASLDSLIASDLNLDGFPEIIATSDKNGRLFAFDSNGNILSGFPVYGANAAPIVGDIDGDGDMEIVAGNDYGKQINAFHHDGTLIINRQWPKVGGGRFIDSPILCDTDNDGKLEIISSSYEGALIYCWELPDSAGGAASLEWSMAGFNKERTNKYTPSNAFRFLVPSYKTIPAGQLLSIEMRTLNSTGMVTLTAAGLPEGANFHDNGDGTGFFTWLTNKSEVGEYTVTFTASCSGVTIAKATNIEVTDPPPYLDPTLQETYNATTGNYFSFDLNAKDDNLSDTVQITIAAKPEWLNITGYLPGNPATMFLGGIPPVAGEYQLIILLASGDDTVTFNTAISVANMSYINIEEPSQGEKFERTNDIMIPVLGGVHREAVSSVSANFYNRTTEQLVYTTEIEVYYHEEAGIFSRNIPVTLFDAGLYRLVVFDYMEDEAEVNFEVITSDIAPPSVIIISPASGGTYYCNPILVSGIVSDDISPITSVLINGVTVEVTTDGMFNYLLYELQAGINVITVMAEDEAGNIGTANVAVIYTPSTEVFPTQSIQSAIDDPQSRPVIFVHKGTYFENLNMQSGKSVIGESAPETIIKGHVIFKEADTSIQAFTIEYPEAACIDFTSQDGTYQNLEMLTDGAITAINSEITVKDCIIMPDPDIYGGDKFGKGIQIWNLYGNPAIAPLIENCEIRGADAGIYLYSQIFGGAILGEIKNNTLDHNNDGILLRMHKEKPIIRDNEITCSINAIHITYEDGSLLQERINNITGNTFTDNNYDIWCDELGEAIQLP